MNELAALCRYSIRKTRGPMIALWVLLFALQVLMVSIARTFEMEGQFSEMARFIPEFIRPFLDPSFLAALSFSGMACFGYSHVIVILLLVAQSIAAGTELVGEIETKFVDLLLARPVARNMLVARSACLVVLQSAGAVAVMVAGSVAGLVLLKPAEVNGPPFAVIASLAANLTILAIAWGGMAMAVAAFVQRRAIAASVTGLLAFGLFVVDFAGRLWQPLDRLAVLSPFRYYAPFQLIAGSPLRVLDVAVLVGVFAAGTFVAVLAYQRRDL